MIRALLGVVLLAGIVSAEPPRYTWKTGDSLTYQSQMKAMVLETTVEDGTASTTGTVTRTAIRRRWDVTAVDAAGTATMTMTITAWRQELARPGPRDKDGKPTVDRTILDSAQPEMGQTFPFVGKALLTLQVDSRGMIVGTAPANASAALPAGVPFRLVFPPEELMSERAAWNRSFAIVVPPPQGTGESYDAQQTWQWKDTDPERVVYTLATKLKNPRTDVAEMPPLIPHLWEGEVQFDPKAGRYLGAKLTAKGNAAQHHGPGSRYEYEAEFSESLVK